jgi:type IV pilus assembly protein PilA
MLHKLRQRAQDEKGFTLIELLVVILIIGILAAIALPAFLGQRTKAQDTAAKTQIRTMQTAMETYYTDNQDYTNANLAALKTIEPSLKDTSGPTPSEPTGGSKTAYTLKSTSVSGNTFTLARDVTAGTTSRTCTVPGTTDNNGGGCNGGSW